MNREPTVPSSLLVHDGELADVRALLEEIGTPYEERRSALSIEDRSANWGLVIASPKRMLGLRLDPTSTTAKIAVMSQDSRTLRNSLRREGIETLVRRPVHPATLRSLIVHELYRGPEKRRTPRVKIGAPAAYRTGWRQRPAILMDLSLGGCRILVDRKLEKGSRVTLCVPADVAGGKAFNVKGEVLKCFSDPDATEAQFVTSARFDALGKRQVANLRAALAAHTDGPAMFDGAPTLPAAGSTTDAAPPAPPKLPTTRPPERVIRAQTAPVATSPEPQERREAPRHKMDRRIASLSEEAARVLMGRDITIGGMRVNRHPTLELGSDIQLAIHTTTRDAPLVVRAKVHRDDGERGMVLRFHALDPDASQYLNEVMDHLPLADVDEDGQGCLVTEILEAG